ncbi:MAG: energy-coupling factor transporter transmembrane protein EcfT [Actinomycetota bacterium]|nr:energy-coupling factor transporter transmembrane protein EcfT [Actinomycetota bacterium]
MIHPAAWLLWAVCTGLCALATTNPYYLVVIMTAATFVYARHRVAGATARAFRFFLVFGIATIVLRTALTFISLDPDAFLSLGIAWPGAGGLSAGVLEGARLATLLVVYGAFNSVSEPYRLLKLAPRRFHEPALAASLAVSLAPRTIATVARVREAQRLRGIDVKRWRALPALAVPVLESGMEEAVTLAESMDSRGHGRGARTRYRPDTWDARATVITAAAIGAVVTFGAYVAGGGGGLVVSTFPLVWPEATLPLVAASALSAVPAVVPEQGAS